MRVCTAFNPVIFLLPSPLLGRGAGVEERSLPFAAKSPRPIQPWRGRHSQDVPVEILQTHFIHTPGTDERRFDDASSVLFPELVQSVNLVRGINVNVQPHPRRSLTLFRQHELHLPQPDECKVRRTGIAGMQKSLLLVGPCPAESKSEAADIILNTACRILHTQDRPAIGYTRETFRRSMVIHLRTQQNSYPLAFSSTSRASRPMNDPARFVRRSGVPHQPADSVPSTMRCELDEIVLHSSHDSALRQHEGLRRER